jgi:ribonucleoside-diphosphate reductase alpha chain
MDNTHLIETNQILRDKLTELGLYSDELMRQIIEHGSLAHVEGIPRRSSGSLSVPTMSRPSGT